MNTRRCGCAKSRYLAMRMLVSSDWVGDPISSHCYACYMLTIFRFVDSICRALCSVTQAPVAGCGLAKHVIHTFTFASTAALVSVLLVKSLYIHIFKRCFDPPKLM